LSLYGREEEQDNENPLVRDETTATNHAIIEQEELEVQEIEEDEDEEEE
jgi:hypothetical protein